MVSTRSTRQPWIAVTLLIVFVFGRMGVGIVAAGITSTTPAPHADPQFEAFKKSCSTDPWAYAFGAVRSVYHEQAVPGSYVDQICSLYGPPSVSFPTGKWLRDYTRRDCFQTQAGDTELPVAPPAPPITGRPGASLGIPLAKPPVA